MTQKRPPLTVENAMTPMLDVPRAFRHARAL